MAVVEEHQGLRAPPRQIQGAGVGASHGQRVRVLRGTTLRHVVLRQGMAKCVCVCVCVCVCGCECLFVMRPVLPARGSVRS